MSDHASKVLQWIGGIVGILTAIAGAVWFLMSFSISEAGKVDDHLTKHATRTHKEAVPRTEFSQYVEAQKQRDMSTDKRLDRIDKRQSVIIDKLDTIGTSQLGARRWKKDSGY